MHRNNLLELLCKYQPHCPLEQKSKEQTIAFVQQNPNCFERTLETGHIVASCWLINQNNTKALLTHHKKLNKWIELGGHCDGDSDVLAVALKEAQEESGIQEIKPLSYDIFDIDVHLIPQYKEVKEHYHYSIVFLLQTAHEDIIISEESNDLRWIEKNINALPSQEEAVMRMFNKWTTL